MAVLVDALDCGRDGFAVIEVASWLVEAEQAGEVFLVENVGVSG